MRCLPWAGLPRLSFPGTLLPADQKLKSTCASSSKQIGCFWEQVWQRFFFFLYYFLLLKCSTVSRKTCILSRVKQGCICYVCQSLFVFVCIELGSWEMFFACLQQRIHTYSNIQTFGSTKFSIDDVYTWVCPSPWSSSPPNLSQRIKLTLFQDHFCWSWALPIRSQRIFYSVPTFYPALMSRCHRRKDRSRQDSCVLAFAS